MPPLVEITLDEPGVEHQEAFDTRVVQDAAVQQCYRVSPVPDFVPVVQVADMPQYLALAQRQCAQREDIFSVRRENFEPKVLLAPYLRSQVATNLIASSFWLGIVASPPTQALARLCLRPSTSSPLDSISKAHTPKPGTETGGALGTATNTGSLMYPSAGLASPTPPSVML